MHVSATIWSMWKRAKRNYDLESRANTMRELMGRVGESVAGTKAHGNVRRIHAHGLFHKFFLHVCSAIQLRSGSVLGSDGLVVVDTASIFVVVRASVEAYLTFEYVFVEKGVTFESNLRYLVWWRQGLLTRQRVAADLPEAAAVMKKEARDLESNESAIRNNIAFEKVLPKQQKGMLEDGKWRLTGWAAIARKCGLSNMYSYRLYSYLSGFAHSESASVMQVLAMYTDSKDEELADNAVSFLLIVSAKMVRAFAAVFPDAWLVVSPQERAFIDRWAAGGTLGM